MNPTYKGVRWDSEAFSSIVGRGARLRNIPLCIFTWLGRDG
jgi:hypothetical protein